MKTKNAAAAVDTTPIDVATEALHRAQQEAAAARSQKDRVHTRIRQCQVEVSRAEAAAGAAEDRVILGEAGDSRAETTQLADARAALDAAQQAGTRSEMLINEANERVTRCQHALTLATADVRLRTALTHLPELEQVIDRLATLHTEIMHEHYGARQALMRLSPQGGDVFPSLSLTQWIAAALYLRKVDFSNVNMLGMTPTFDIAVPVHQVTDNILRHVALYREKYSESEVVV